jgi:hypothetical protein
MTNAAEEVSVSVEEAARRLSISPAIIRHIVDDKRLTASRSIGPAGARPLVGFEKLKTYSASQPRLFAHALIPSAPQVRR